MEKFLDNLALTIYWTGRVIVIALVVGWIGWLLYLFWRDVGFLMFVPFGVLGILVAYFWASDRVNHRTETWLSDEDVS